MPYDGKLHPAHSPDDIHILVDTYAKAYKTATMTEESYAHTRALFQDGTIAVSASSSSSSTSYSTKARIAMQIALNTKIFVSIIIHSIGLMLQIYKNSSNDIKFLR